MAAHEPHVTATVTELPESRVRIEATVLAGEVQRSVDETARRLGRSMRIPGFRKGKVPPALVVKQVGREAVLDEAVRGEISHWYGDAVAQSGLVTVGEPSIEIGELPDAGEPLGFTIEIGVRPKAQLGDYKGLEVGRREPEVDEAAIDAEVERLRERLARLETVERPAETGDYVVMDYRGTVGGEPFAGGEGRDQLVELGAGNLVPGFEEQVVGAAAGEERTITVTFPEDAQAEGLAGREVEFAVTVKEVKRKELPELGDEFASDAAGFDTLAELREDIATRMREAEESAIEAEFREAALDAAVAEATIDLPDALIDARAHEMFDQLIHQIGHQGISKEAYLRIAGKSEEELIEEVKPDAERDLRRQAVVAAIVEAEPIEPTEEELLEALEPVAAQDRKLTPQKLLERLRAGGRDESLKADLATRKAIDLVASEAQAITVEQAKARDKLWTPGREEQAGRPELWTPSS